METLTDRYELFEHLGQGGYGSVWRAFDRELQREVAIKMLQVEAPSASRESLKARFRREAVATAKIVHPSVVTIFDVGTVPDRDEIYVVMELLQGSTLGHELMVAGPLEPRRAVLRFAEALEGLGEAHAMGIVHKDLKPANLFLQHAGTSRERLKVIDFGIARMDSLDSLTRTGRVVGSPRFLAPEYILGHDVTPAVDVYQMGLILAECLTGQPCMPRGLEYMDCCKLHVDGSLRFPSRLLDSPVGPVIDRATATSAQDRFADGAEFAAALRVLDVSSIGETDLASREDTPRADVIVHDDDRTTQPFERGTARPTTAPDKKTAPSLPRHRGHEELASSAGPAQQRGERAEPPEPRSNARLIALAATLLVLIVGSAAIVATLLEDDATERGAETADSPAAIAPVRQEGSGAEMADGHPPSPPEEAEPKADPVEPAEPKKAPSADAPAHVSDSPEVADRSSSRRTERRRKRTRRREPRLAPEPDTNPAGAEAEADVGVRPAPAPWRRRADDEDEPSEQPAEEARWRVMD